MPPPRGSRQRAGNHPNSLRPALQTLRAPKLRGRSASHPDPSLRKSPPLGNHPQPDPGSDRRHGPEGPRPQHHPQRGLAVTCDLSPRPRARRDRGQPTAKLALPRDRRSAATASRNPGRSKRFWPYSSRGHRVLWSAAVYAGLRRGELQALDWKAINLEAGVLRVEHSWDRVAGLVSPKSRSGERSVPIPGVLGHELREFRLRQGTGGEGFVFFTAVSAHSIHRMRCALRADLGPRRVLARLVFTRRATPTHP